MNESTAVLYKAQRQLEAMQQKLGITIQPPAAPIAQDAPSAITPPPHLGWESVAVTAVARQAEQRRAQQQAFAEARQMDWLTLPSPQQAITPAPEKAKTDVTIYPDLAMAMLRQEQTAAGRIWLLLRHLDTTGRGWLSIETVRARLASKGEPLRVCGWRQMRNLLSAGDGLFWRRDRERVWLFGVMKTAVSLQVPYLQQRPVAVPVAALAKSIGCARAHLYATFHSSRSQEMGAASPIARATLTDLSAVSGHTQRKYEQQAGVTASANYSVGEKLGGTGAEEQAWQNGRAAFTLTDKKGMQGQANNSYIAWQLPNSYAGPHAHQPRGQQKRINRHLADLFMKGMTGNSEKTTDTFRPRRFFADGKKAAAKNGDGRLNYWRSHHNGIWYTR